MYWQARAHWLRITFRFTFIFDVLNAFCYCNALSGERECIKQDRTANYILKLKFIARDSINSKELLIEISARSQRFSPVLFCFVHPFWVPSKGWKIFMFPVCIVHGSTTMPHYLERVTCIMSLTIFIPYSSIEMLKLPFCFLFNIEWNVHHSVGLHKNGFFSALFFFWFCFCFCFILLLWLAYATIFLMLVTLGATTIGVWLLEWLLFTTIKCLFLWVDQHTSMRNESKTKSGNKHVVHTLYVTIYI